MLMRWKKSKMLLMSQLKPRMRAASMGNVKISMVKEWSRKLVDQVIPKAWNQLPEKMNLSDSGNRVTRWLKCGSGDGQISHPECSSIPVKSLSFIVLDVLS